MFDIEDLNHADEDDLEFYVRGSLKSEHISLLDAHLLHCQTCREQLSRCIGRQIASDPKERAKLERTYERAEPRFSTGDDAMFQELNPLSFDRHLVKIVDISRSGIGILAQKAVFPGTIVQIRIMGTVELGEVRHSSARGDKAYRIGLRLRNGL